MRSCCSGRRPASCRAGRRGCCRSCQSGRSPCCRTVRWSRPWSARGWVGCGGGIWEEYALQRQGMRLTLMLKRPVYGRGGCVRSPETAAVHANGNRTNKELALQGRRWGWCQDARTRGVDAEASSRTKIWDSASAPRFLGLRVRGISRCSLRAASRMWRSRGYPQQRRFVGSLGRSCSRHHSKFGSCTCAWNPYW